MLKRGLAWGPNGTDEQVRPAPVTPGPLLGPTLWHHSSFEYHQCPSYHPAKG